VLMSLDTYSWILINKSFSLKIITDVVVDTYIEISLKNVNIKIT